MGHGIVSNKTTPCPSLEEGARRDKERGSQERSRKREPGEIKKEGARRDTLLPRLNTDRQRAHYTRVAST